MKRDRPPGSDRIVAAILPPRLAYNWAQLERYGLIILLVLLFTGVIGRVLGPLFAGLYDATLRLAGLA